MPLVSTIIPAYNAATFIREAVDSALAQTHAEQEIVIVDDGSTDDTPAILEEYGDQIHVVRQKNAGPAVARNTGARRAKGEWLAFLDSDDSWLPDKLQHQLAIADDDVSLVYTDRLNFGAASHVSARQSDLQELPEGDIFDEIIAGNPITTSSVIIRRADFFELGGFDEDPDLVAVEDWEFWTRFAATGKRVRVCPDALTRYRWHPAKISFDHHACCRRRRVVVERVLQLPRAKSLSRRKIREARAHVWQASAWYASEMHPFRAAAWYARSAFYSPWNLDVYKSILRCCLGRS